MITINGQKMGKSLGNFITLEQFFTGDHPALTQAYTPMTIRFFILQAHYRGTVDFSNEALQAAEKALERMLDGWHRLNALTAAPQSSPTLDNYRQRCADAMNDDLNTPVVISHLFEAGRAINSVYDGKATISAADLKELQEVFDLFIADILGLRDDAQGGNAKAEAAYHAAVDMLLRMRMEAKANKDWAKADQIRNELTALGFEIKDRKDGFEWKLV
jgi:cysteinyl-tRNA synthetase